MKQRNKVNLHEIKKELGGDKIIKACESIHEERMFKEIIKEKGWGGLINIFN